MPSIFAKLTERIKQARGADDTINAEKFLAACREFVPVIEKFGTGFVMIKSDISGNIDRLETCRQRDPGKFKQLFQIIEDEISRGKQADKYSDARGLLWLYRAMEFVDALLLRLYEDRSVSLSVAASEVYHQTLYQYHTWYTSAAFQLALKLVPSREAFFEKLEAANEEAMGEMHLFVETFAPLLTEIDQFLKSHGLDDPTPV